jgi:hypothetical protein
MRTRNALLGVCLVLTVALAAGCEKDVRITWTNTTAQLRTVELAGPGVGATYVGNLPPDGGKVRYKLEVDDDLLPADYQWQAGDQSGRFTVTDETPDELWIDIKPGGPGGPRDEDTEVTDEHQMEIREMPVYQEEVVE